MAIGPCLRAQAHVVSSSARKSPMDPVPRLGFKGSVFRLVLAVGRELDKKDLCFILQYHKPHMSLFLSYEAEAGFAAVRPGCDAAQAGFSVQGTTLIISFSTLDRQEEQDTKVSTELCLSTQCQSGKA